jgi:primosomal protein N' (replication factor Y)
MFIQVQLLTGFSKPLWYKVPVHLAHMRLHNTIIQVPLRNQIVPAVVISEFEDHPDVPFEIKELSGIEPFPPDVHYLPFIQKLSTYYQLEQLHFIKRIKKFLTQDEVNERVPKNNSAIEYRSKIVTLTPEQKTVVDFLLPRVAHGGFTPTVLHGVTGSGKTEVYKELIKQAIVHNKTALLLLPEVTLATTFAHRLRAELPQEIVIHSFHSAVSPKEKRHLWHSLVEQKPLLIIGVHLPVLLPISNLGVIIVDEEHEVGYQEKKHPKINSKEAALLRAQLHNIPILLGSATPSMLTLHNVKTRNWHFFELKKRFAGSFPTVRTVLLSDKKQRKNFWISQILLKAIEDRLSKKEQTIIFLNRRGFSFFVQCKACSFIFECNTCSVSLTLHAHNQLSCHYCDFAMQLPTACTKCSAHEEQFLKKGIGTQQVVSILNTLFPAARIARADLDTTTNKKKWQQTIHDFEHGNLDILVGTQTITKGYHFPHVTLVGILWADLNLHFPIYNASEITLQQLIQVAGRAGRQKDGSEVIVQAMGEHPIFQFLNEVDYPKFYDAEFAVRQELSYPPCGRLAEIELKHTDEQEIEREAQAIAAQLFAECLQGTISARVLGPAKPPVHKVKNWFSRKIYIKSPQMGDIIRLYQMIDQRKFSSFIYFTPNP